jgi:hypothetical protein
LNGSKKNIGGGYMDELQDQIDTVIIDEVISDQVNLLFYMQQINFPDLYDAWNDDKIKIVTNCMKIIERRQVEILKEVKQKPSQVG